MNWTVTGSPAAEGSGRSLVIVVVVGAAPRLIGWLVTDAKPLAEKRSV